MGDIVILSAGDNNANKRKKMKNLPKLHDILFVNQNFNEKKHEYTFKKQRDINSNSECNTVTKYKYFAW